MVTVEEFENKLSSLLWRVGECEAIGDVHDSPSVILRDYKRKLQEEVEFMTKELIEIYAYAATPELKRT